MMSSSTSTGTSGISGTSIPLPHIPIIIKKPFGGTNSPGAITGLSMGAARLPGIFPSSRYGQQVISSGIPSLDSYLGNGFPICSIIIIKDVFPCHYADMILKCFIAEGATYNHHIYVKSGGSVSSVFANQLPSLVTTRQSANTIPGNDERNFSADDDTESMKIAWRYKDISPLPTTLSTRGRGIINKGQQKISTKFEFVKKCTVEELGGHHLTVSNIGIGDGFSKDTPVSFEPTKNTCLLKEIAGIAKEFDNTVDGRKPKNFLRIALSHCEDELTPSFMTNLRALVRHTNSCVVITNSDLKFDTGQSFKIEHFADYVIQVQGIVDELKKKQFGENIDGLCEIKKLDSIYSIKPMEKPKDLGFSFKKKTIIFQELHLQPEDDTTAQRETSSKPSTKLHQESSSCGSTIKGKSIDF